MPSTQSSHSAEHDTSFLSSFPHTGGSPRQSAFPGTHNSAAVNSSCSGRVKNLFPLQNTQTNTTAHFQGPINYGKCPLNSQPSSSAIKRFQWSGYSTKALQQSPKTNEYPAQPKETNEQKREPLTLFRPFEEDLKGVLGSDKDPNIQKNALQGSTEDSPSKTSTAPSKTKTYVFHDEMEETLRAFHFANIETILDITVNPTPEQELRQQSKSAKLKGFLSDIKIHKPLMPARDKLWSQNGPNIHPNGSQSSNAIKSNAKMPGAYGCQYTNHFNRPKFTTQGGPLQQHSLSYDSHMERETQELENNSFSRYRSAFSPVPLRKAASFPNEHSLPYYAQQADQNKRDRTQGDREVTVPGCIQGPSSTSSCTKRYTRVSHPHLHNPEQVQQLSSANYPHYQQSNLHANRNSHILARNSYPGPTHRYHNLWRSNVPTRKNTAERHHPYYQFQPAKTRRRHPAPTNVYLRNNTNNTISTSSTPDKWPSNYTKVTYENIRKSHSPRK
eukprot:Nk52_evm11s490 gene=Nk52_evmTU11s490